MRCAALIIVALAAALCLAPGAGAATIEVTSEAESGPGSLGAAILRSEPGDTIRIPAGEYLLTNGDVLEANDLTLIGAGAERTTIIPSGGGEAFDDEGVTVAALTVGQPRQAASGDDAGIGTRAQVIALVVTFAIFLLVLDLVRRRRLVERYALLWMTAALALLLLAIWTEGLEEIADLMGIEEPANAIFILAFGVGFLLLLNFSVVSSRLSEETKVLAQEVARLEYELDAEKAKNGSPVAAEQRSERS